MSNGERTERHETSALKRAKTQMLHKKEPTTK